jgi:hypothetical protein
MLESDPTPLRRFFAYRLLEHLHSNTSVEEFYWATLKPPRFNSSCVVFYGAKRTLEKKRLPATTTGTHFLILQTCWLEDVRFEYILVCNEDY